MGGCCFRRPPTIFTRVGGSLRFYSSQQLEPGFFLSVLVITSPSKSERQKFDLLADALLHTDYASATAYNITQDQLHMLLVAQQASWHIDEQSPLFTASSDYDQVNAILDESSSGLTNIHYEGILLCNLESAIDVWRSA